MDALVPAGAALRNAQSSVSTHNEQVIAQVPMDCQPAEQSPLSFFAVCPLGASPVHLEAGTLDAPCLGWLDRQLENRGSPQRALRSVDVAWVLNLCPPD